MLVSIKDKMSPKIIKTLQKAGCDVEKTQGLHVISGITYGDEKWEIYEKWFNSLVEASPMVQSIWRPPVELAVGRAEGVVVPSPIIAGNLLNETASVIHIGVSLSDLASVYTPIIVRASESLSAIHEAVSLGNNPLYPTISSLEVGSYVCTIQVTWSNAVTFQDIFKQ
jgi:hypothetical protein